MKLRFWPWLNEHRFGDLAGSRARFLNRLIAVLEIPAPDTPQLLQRITIMEQHIVLPLKAAGIAMLLYSFYFTPWIGEKLSALEVSAYSLVALSQRARGLMTNGGSVLTLTYYGSEKVIPHYNVMGVAKAALEASVRYLAYDLGRQKIRVNAISAGPIKTLAAAGVGGFRSMLEYCEKNAPLRRLVSTDDVGNMALSLCSDLGAAVTGETLYVDAGFNIMGMPSLDKPTA